MKAEEIIQEVKENRLGKVYKHLHKAYPSIKKWVLANNGSKQDAEDIFQETLVAFCINCRKPNFQLSSQLNTYLISIAKNQWLKALRKRGKELNTKIDDADSVHEDEDQYVLAEQAFQILGKKCQELLAQFYVLKLSFKEISHRLDFSNEKVAKNQKYRCLNKAKEHYRSLLEEGGELC